MHALSWQRLGLFAVLVLIGLSYIGSLAYFSRHSVNYLDAGKAQHALKMAKHAHLSVPETLRFGSGSRWTNYLVAGWHAPQQWGVWARGTDAELILPPVANISTDKLCIAITLGSLPPRKSWPMQITINGTSLGHASTYHGGGPFTYKTIAKITPGSPIYINFHGPDPVIPRSLDRHTNDYRTLSFSLFDIALMKTCQ